MLGSASGSLERVSQRSGLRRRHLDNEPAATFKRDPHDDAAPFFGDLERTVTRPRLHGRHAVHLFLAETAWLVLLT